MFSRCLLNTMQRLTIAPKNHVLFSRTLSTLLSRNVTNVKNLHILQPKRLDNQFMVPTTNNILANMTNSLLLGGRLGGTRSINSRAQKHKRFLRKYAKGYRGRSKNCFRIAIRRVHKAWQYAYRDRRRKKREWRKLWIMRLQAGVRQYDWKYSRFIAGLKLSNVRLNRKVLAEMAANEPFSFRAVVNVVEDQAGQYKNV